MNILRGEKDGGKESRVRCWGVESKRFGSVLLLKFEEGSREAFHTHAFNSLSWVLAGGLLESNMIGEPRTYPASFVPVVTRRTTFHKVTGLKPANWVLTFRGPWVDVWREFLPRVGRFIRLTHGRKEIK